MTRGKHSCEGTHDYFSPSRSRASAHLQASVRLGTLSGLAVKCVSFGSHIVIVPLLLNAYGVELFGLWSAVLSITSFLAFADFGIGNGLLNAFASKTETADDSRVQDAFSSAWFTMLVIAALIGMVGLAVVHIAPWGTLFGLRTHEQEAIATRSVAIVVICFAAGMPTSLARRINLGHHEAHLAHLYTIIGLLLGLVLVIAGAKNGVPLSTALCFYLLGPIIANVANTLTELYIRRPHLRPSLSRWTKAQSTDLLSAGTVFVALQLMAVCGMFLDTAIIANQAGVEEAAKYALAARYLAITQLAALAAVPLWPAFGRAIAMKQISWARRTVRIYTALSVMSSFLVGALLIVTSNKFLPMLSSDLIAVDRPLLLSVLLFYVFNAHHAAVSSFLNNSTTVKKTVKAFFVATVVAIILKVLGIYVLGATGAALGTVLGYAALYIVQPWRIINQVLKDSDATGPVLKSKHVDSY